MKTIKDFKVVNGVATLEGVAYAEEAKVVDEFLKANDQIKQVSIISKDGRNFELKNKKLVLSNEQYFLNPYLIKEIKDDNQETVENILNKNNIDNRIMNIHEIEQQLKILDNKVNEINSLIKQISQLLNTNIK